MTVGRIIEAPACVAEGAAWLAGRDARLAEAVRLCAPLPLRRTEDGFARLLQAIVGQQVSTASARAIWARIEAAGATTAEAVGLRGVEGMRALGLSRPKARYAAALAEAGIDYEALRTRPDAEVIATLVAVPGIGRWTAEVYAMFALGRADVFAAGDLALQEGARLLYGLPGRPGERELRAMAERWAPWRAVAARALWAYYARAKGREGTP